MDFYALTFWYGSALHLRIQKDVIPNPLKSSSASQSAVRCRLSKLTRMLRSSPFRGTDMATASI